MLLGYGPMDERHIEFARLLSRFSASTATVDLKALQEVHDHLVTHFGEENNWMLETDFPARVCHMDEHAAVLRSSEEVLDLAREGDFSAARSILAELAAWFPGHADYLDSALAAWMCKRQYGGKPVIVHRIAVRN